MDQGHGSLHAGEAMTPASTTEEKGAIRNEDTLIQLNLSKPTRLNPALFERWEREYIAVHSFEEMWEDANETLQPGCRYNRLGHLWLERKDMQPLPGSHRAETGINTHAEQTLIEGEARFGANMTPKPLHIEVLRCKHCGCLAISVDDTRLDTKSCAGNGHGDGKCAGMWTVLVSALHHVRKVQELVKTEAK